MPKNNSLLLITSSEDVQTWVDEIIQRNLKTPNGNYSSSILTAYHDLVNQNSKFELYRLIKYNGINLNFLNIDEAAVNKRVEVKFKNRFDENYDVSEHPMQYLQILADGITTQTKTQQESDTGFHKTICKSIRSLANIEEKMEHSKKPQKAELQLLYFNGLHDLYMASHDYLSKHSGLSLFRGEKTNRRVNFVEALTENIEHLVLGLNYKGISKEKRVQQKEKINSWYTIASSAGIEYIKVLKKPDIVYQTVAMSDKKDLINFDSLINPSITTVKGPKKIEDVISENYSKIDAKLSKYIKPAANQGNGWEMLLHAATELSKTFSESHNKGKTCFNKLITEPLKQYIETSSKSDHASEKADTVLSQIYYNATLYLKTHPSPHSDRGMVCKTFAMMMKKISAVEIHNKSLEYKAEIMSKKAEENNIINTSSAVRSI